MPAKIIWNDDLDNALRELVAQGAGREACEDRMGISWPTIRKRLRELGIEIVPSRSTQPRTLRGIELVQQGLSRQEAARAAGTSADTIGAALRRRARG